MAVTIQQIADKAGVSRGTVDRALNHRGRIDPQVAQRVEQVAKELGYVQKHRKKREKKIANGRIGVVTQLAKASFMLEINRGICQAKKELAERGIEVIVKEGLQVNEEEQLNAIDELIAKGIQGLAIMAVDSNQVREKINWVAEKLEIPVITFNSDIVGTKRLCFIGMDNRKSGHTAAGLLGMLTRGQGKVLVITGHFTNYANNMRVTGFLEEVKETYPDLEIAGIQASFDDPDEVERIIVNAMNNVQGINAILVVSAGQAGVSRAFETLNLEKRPYVIVYDQTPRNKRALAERTVDFLIDQNGYIQGYQPLHVLANLLIKGEKPQKEYLFTEIKIKTKDNL